MLIRFIIVVLFVAIAACSVVYVSGDGNVINDDKDRGIFLDANDPD